MFPARLFREAIRNNDSFLLDIGPKGDGGPFSKEIGRESGGIVLTNLIVVLETHFFIGAFIQQAWHAKS